MKSKNLKLLLLAIPTLLLTSCNFRAVDTVYNYKKVHVFETATCYEIDNWRDYDGEQIQVKIKDKGYCLFHSNQIVLITDKCPFCE